MNKICKMCKKSDYEEIEIDNGISFQKITLKINHKFCYYNEIQLTEKKIADLQAKICKLNFKLGDLLCKQFVYELNDEYLERNPTP